MKKYGKTLLVCIILFVVFSISVGYSVFSSELSTSNIVANIRVQKDIRITNVSLLSESSNDIKSNGLNYDVESILDNVTFNSLSSYVMYKVAITNIGNVEMGIYNISLPEGFGYEISNYNLNDKICNSSGSCSLGISKEIDIKVYPISEDKVGEHSIKLDLDFREIHSITYKDIAYNGYITEIIDGGNLNVVFTGDISENIVVYSDGVKVDSSQYTYSNGVLSINNVHGDLIIKSTKNLYNMIKSKTNGVDTNINFRVASSETNGDGVNTVSGTENNQYSVYYYRGAVTDNNVRFANFCWKIVRTTETGGVKLIYNGVPSEDGSCNNTGTIGTSAFNSLHTSSPASVGYMYGTIYPVKTEPLSEQIDTYLYGNDVSWDGTNYTLAGDTKSSSSWATDRNILATKYHYTCFNDTGICENVYYISCFNNTQNVYYLTLKDGKDIEKVKEEMFTNTTDSTIKAAIDNWYAANMTSYTDKLEDTIWCNDRALTSGSLYSKDTSGMSDSVFGAYNRNVSIFKPTVTCTNIRDSFTVGSANGNGKLTYPVGLLTADEYTMAGSGFQGHSTSAYLHMGQIQWSLSPYFIYRNYTRLFELRPSNLNNGGSNHVCGVRPSVSLKPGTYVYDGDGSVSNPYVVD